MPIPFPVAPTRPSISVTAQLPTRSDRPHTRNLRQMDSSNPSVPAVPPPPLTPTST
ncbi:uncharacterized protein K452DRAFT_285742 [Aplosporella prunicola CBS 121167]|uniref:Uncharacterized protein n=1 Tax=Aplosporella prunicola CBS 121167 TaxID=1176127 RepID=A0A6A6BJZ1_9PEZI|nr:uncharacterized protein K452DRAFT_285742 [Aplosporella prunicola CBS 121167]KAF2143703.1 hypothetical protein K452DRAFT_285742 [Aplosporella prunicola CBS 121167]